MIQLQTYEDFYNAAPEKLKKCVDNCKGIPQTLEWHSEGTVDIHNKIVFNRAKRTGDINLMLAAFFHDLGKATTTVKHPTIPNKYSTKLHDKESAKIVKENKQWIEDIGGNYDIVFYLVEQHMRAKITDEMRPYKREKFKSHIYYSYMEKFSEFDNMKTDYSNDING